MSALAAPLMRGISGFGSKVAAMEDGVSTYPKLRKRMPAECSLGFASNLLVAAESRNPIWKELLERVPLIVDGQYVKNLMYVFKAPAFALKLFYDTNTEAGDERDEDTPIVNIQTVNSWLDDLFYSLAKACALVLSKYSSLVFIATFATLEKVTSFLVLVFVFVVTAAVPIMTAKFTTDRMYANLKSTGDLVVEDAEAEGKPTLTPYEENSIWYSLWFVTFLGVANHIREAPIFFSPITMVGKKVFAKVGKARTLWTEYRSQSEQYVLEHEGQHVHSLACFACDVLMMIVKLYISAQDGSITCVFMLFSIGVPAVVDVWQLITWNKLRKARSVYLTQLKKALQSPDFSIRRSAKDSLKRHYPDIKLEARNPDADGIFVGEAAHEIEVWNAALLAGRVIRKLQGVINDLKYIHNPEKGPKLLADIHDVENTPLPQLIEALARQSHARYCRTLNYSQITRDGEMDVNDSLTSGFCGESGEQFLKADWVELALAKLHNIDLQEKVAMRECLTNSSNCQLPGLESRRSHVVSLDEPLLEPLKRAYFPEGGVIYTH